MRKRRNVRAQRHIRARVGRGHDARQRQQRHQVGRTFAAERGGAERTHRREALARHPLSDFREVVAPFAPRYLQLDRYPHPRRNPANRRRRPGRHLRRDEVLDARVARSREDALDGHLPRRGARSHRLAERAGGDRRDRYGVFRQPHAVQGRRERAPHGAGRIREDRRARIGGRTPSGAARRHCARRARLRDVRGRRTLSGRAVHRACDLQAQPWQRA